MHRGTGDRNTLPVPEARINAPRRVSALTTEATDRWSPKWYGRAVNRAALTLALLFTSVATAQESVAVRGTAVSLERAGEAPVRTLGPFEFVAGLKLQSDDPRFGGISGMVLVDSGSALLAVSDNGRLFHLPLVRDATGKLTGVGPATTYAIAAAGGAALDRGEGDSEELQLLPDGRLLVSFEHHHRLATIGQLDSLKAATERPFATPKGIELAPKNGGLEALFARADGSVLAIREKPLSHDGKHAAWLIREAPEKSETLYYWAKDGFQPTALAPLAGGDLLGLERRYTILDGIAARLVRFPASAIAAGAQVQTTELGRFTTAMICDNFEAMATEPARAGRGATTVFIASDDNFNPAQHTYLLQFTLPGP